MPVAMTASVMTTANHYMVDWVIGCAIAASSFMAAWMWDRRRTYNMSVTHASDRPDLVQ